MSAVPTRPTWRGPEAESRNSTGGGESSLWAVHLAPERPARLAGGARREGVLDHITFRRAGNGELTSGNDRFDAVAVESMLALVEDAATLIRESIRVARLGEYEGLIESYWRGNPPVEILAIAVCLGVDIIAEAKWRAAWDVAPAECVRSSFFAWRATR